MSTIRKLCREKGLTMRDATKPLRLEVAHEDIAQAKLKNHGECAFAVACRRSYDIQAAYFLRSTAYIQAGKQLLRYQLPGSVMREIVAFDRSRAMEPGSYHLKPPARSGTLGAAKARGKKRTGRHVPTGTSGRKFHVHHTTNVRGSVL